MTIHQKPEEPAVEIKAPSGLRDTSRPLRPETLALHGGSYRFDPVTGAVAVPIYQTTSYQLPGTDGADKLFALEAAGHLYTRVSNPTQDAFEQRLAEIEGGAAALALGSGQAASAYALLNLARSGDNIVSAAGLYGGTWALFASTLKSFGIEVRFIDASDPEAFAPRQPMTKRGPTMRNPFPIRASRSFRSARSPRSAAVSAFRLSSTTPRHP